MATKAQPPEPDLPTTTRLGISTADVTSADAPHVASEWLRAFADKIARNDVDGVLNGW